MQGIIINKETLILLGVTIWVVYFFMKCINHRDTLNKKNILNEISKLLLILYLLLLIGVTLLPIRLPRITTFDIEPVINLNILNIFSYEFNKYAIINIFGNVFLLAPLPILLYLNGYNKFLKVRNIIYFSFMLSLTIEVLQYFEAYFNFIVVSRATDVLDLILNTLGGLLGYCVLWIYQKKFNGFKRKLVKPEKNYIK